MTRAWGPALLGLALVGVGFFVHTLPEGADAFLARTSGLGLTAFFLAATALCALGVPRQVAAYAGAFAFGLPVGGAVALLAQVAACGINLIAVRMVGRGWAERQMQRRLGGRLSRLDAFLRANPFTATLTLRLLPVGNNLALNLLAGLSGIPPGPFLLASALGYVPQTLIFALLGAGMRVGHPTQLVIAAALFGASAVSGGVLVRRFRTAGA